MRLYGHVGSDLVYYYSNSSRLQQQNKQHTDFLFLVEAYTFNHVTLSGVLGIERASAAAVRERTMLNYDVPRERTQGELDNHVLVHLQYTRHSHLLYLRACVLALAYLRIMQTTYVRR